MQSGKTIHVKVAEEATGKGWSVSITTNGQRTFFAVFRKKEDAKAFADAERRNPG